MLGQWWRRPGVWVLLGLVLVLGVGAIHAWRSLWPVHVKTLARQHTDAGYAAWRAGKVHEAAIAFDSALALDPEESRPAILRARMDLSAGRRDAAIAVFERWLSRTRGDEREQLVAIYRDSLVCAGLWSELAAFSGAELSRRKFPDARLLGGLIEGARLARWTDAEVARAMRTCPLDAVSTALLRAQVALNVGAHATARRELGALTQPLPPVVSLIAGRLWVRAGDRIAARLAVARVTGELNATELLLANLALSGGDDFEWQNARRDLRALTDAMRGSPELAGPVLDHVIAWPDAGVATELSRTLAPAAKRLPPEVVSALWLYCSLSGADAEVVVWREQLGARFGLWPINLDRRRLDERVFLFAANAVPLSRYALDSLLAALPAEPRAVTPSPR